MESFSAGYGQARMKFVEATKAQGGALERIAHPARGPNGAALSMDIAWFGDRSASKVFVAFSGVHGVEGFFGSGVQIEWIHRGENRRLPRDTAALLVHAVNPYGFAWLRRTNKDNVDLNRNWIDFDHPLPTSERLVPLALASLVLGSHRTFAASLKSSLPFWYFDSATRGSFRATRVDRDNCFAAGLKAAPVSCCAGGSARLWAADSLRCPCTKNLY